MTRTILGQQSTSTSVYWAAAIAAGSLLVLGQVFHSKKRSRRDRISILKGEEDPPTTASNDKDYYDVIVVGAGPAGSTCSYYLGHAKQGLRVLLLERKTFPRVKYCGDAWCSQALDIMEEMQWDATTGKNVLEYIMKDLKQGHAVQRGGFISPCGHECINTEGASYGSVSQIRTYAMKRVIVDEILARAAQKQPGVELREDSNVNVSHVKFLHEENHWQVPISTTTDNTTTATVVKGRVLVAADGATSYLARHLGLVTEDANVVCSHRYSTSSGDHFAADGVMFFNRAILPGYSALFKHYNNDVYLGTYILPGGKATARSIAGYEQELVNQHPYVRQAFGGSDNHGAKIYDNIQWRNDLSQGENGKMRTAPIRAGGEEYTSGDHLLVIGDAAGQTDPMTGEGIHTAMVAAKLAAQTIVEMFQAHNFGAAATGTYHDKWKQAFGHDFQWSALGAKLIYWFPILLDAAAAYGRDAGGQAFLDEFGLIMTGVKPKSDFLQLRLAVPICGYLVRELFLQYVWRRPPLIPQSIGQTFVDKYYKPKQ